MPVDPLYFAVGLAAWLLLVVGLVAACRMAASADARDAEHRRARGVSSTDWPTWDWPTGGGVS